MSARELRLYRPANGTEGDYFKADWCARCIHDKVENGTAETPGGVEGDWCDILTTTYCLDTDDPGYPREWCYDAQGEPQCTAFSPLDAAPNATPTPRAPGTRADGRTRGDT